MGREKKEIEYNLHHICPSSRGGLTNDSNCEMIRKTTHSAIHTLFSNQILGEQIKRLIDLNAKAVKPEIAAELIDCLSQRDLEDPRERYKEECLWMPKHKIYK